MTGSRKGAFAAPHWHSKMHGENTLELRFPQYLQAKRDEVARDRHLLMAHPNCIVKEFLRRGLTRAL